MILKYGKLSLNNNQTGVKSFFVSNISDISFMSLTVYQNNKVDFHSPVSLASMLILISYFFKWLYWKTTQMFFCA